MPRRRLYFSSRFPLLPITILVLLCGSASAQTTFGTILGTVTDSTGAVVPAVAITVRNEGTNIAQETSANERGDYSVTHLNPGTYSISASQAGFKKFTKTGIVLETANTVRADVALEVGEVGTEVTVAGSAPLVESDASNLAGIRTNDVMERMPLNVRGNFNGFFYTMLALTPGAIQGSGSAFSMAGTRGMQNQFTVDGTSTNSPLFGNAIGPAQTSMESTMELRVDLANNKAEYSVPGEITGSSKSGQNTPHGSLFDYLDNGDLNARNTFSTTVPFAIANDFGGSLGAPVYLPKIYNGKNRTFFFYTFESFPQRSESVVAPNVPTVAFRGGDFSALSGTVVKDPLTGTPFPNNQIPSSRLNPSAVTMQSLFYPMPNYGLANAYTGNYRGTIHGNGYKHQHDVRIDHHLSSANSFFGRLSYGTMAGNSAQSNLPAVGILDQHRKAATVTIADTHIINPGTINEFRYGMVWNNNPFGLPWNGPSLMNQLGIQGLTPSDVNSIPAVTMTGFTGVTASNYWGWANERAHDFVDNITLIRGNHSLKAGIEFLRNMGAEYPLNPAGTLGSWSFSGTYSGFAWADFLLGIPQTASRGNVAGVAKMVNTDFDAFLQDDWKVSRRLTINVGIRYNVDPPYHETSGRMFNFLPATGQLVVPQAGLAYLNPVFPTNLIPVVSAKQAGVSDGLFNTQWVNFAPRFGFAYRPQATADFVVRGGYGFFYDTNTVSLYSAVTGGPFVSNESFTNSITNGVPLFMWPHGFPSGFGAVATQSFTPINPNLKLPYIEQWNLTVERAVFNMGLRVSYIGTVSHQLNWMMNINQAVPSLTPFSNTLTTYPNIKSVNYVLNGGNSAYNSLHVVAERKNRSSLYYQLGWTWAKDLTDDPNEGSDNGSTPENSYNRGRDRGNVVYSPRHRLVGQLLYTLPFGPGRPFLSALHGAGRALAGGWTISSALTAQTGTWFSPSFSGTDVSNTNTIGGRPDVLAGAPLYPAHQTIYDWFNVAAFGIPGCGTSTPVCAKPADVGRFGTAAYNMLEGPGLLSLNSGIHKYFTFRERARLLIQFTATNVLNHVNYSNPSTNISSPATVGVITSAGAARSGEVAARFEF